MTRIERIKGILSRHSDIPTSKTNQLIPTSYADQLAIYIYTLSAEGIEELAAVLLEIKELSRGGNNGIILRKNKEVINGY